MMLQFMWFAMGCIVTVLTFIGIMTLISIARFYEQEADTDTSLPEEIKQFVATQPNFWQRLKFAVTGKTGIDTDATQK